MEKLFSKTAFSKSKPCNKITCCNYMIMLYDSSHICKTYDKNNYTRDFFQRPPARSAVLSGALLCMAITVVILHISRNIILYIHQLKLNVSGVNPVNPHMLYFRLILLPTGCCLFWWCFSFWFRFISRELRFSK